MKQMSASNQSFIISAFLSAFAAAFLYAGMKIEEAEAVLAKEGVSVQGTITSKTLMQNKGNRLGLLKYKYQAGGVVFQGSEYVKSYVFLSIDIGAPIKVIYSPSNPSYSKTSYSPGKNSVMFYLVAVAIFVLSGAFLYGGVVKKRYGE